MVSIDPVIIRIEQFIIKSFMSSATSLCVLMLYLGLYIQPCPIQAQLSLYVIVYKRIYSLIILFLFFIYLFCLLKVHCVCVYVCV